MNELLATIRLQLNHEFDFLAAAEHVPYFAALGLSHVYLSPIAMSRPGSMHGYDVINPMIVNPELGGEPALARFIQTLHTHGMSAILDIVPNHMAADVANPWWNDVLAMGRASRYAHYFDIDWHAPHTSGKLWLPILAVPLEQTLARGDLQVERHVGGTTIALSVPGTKLPISEQSLRLLFDLADQGLPRFKNASDAIDAVRLAMQDKSLYAHIDHAIAQLHADKALMRRFLDLQHYRLAWWRSASQVINYRRFFDIDSLVALATERDDVFDAVHALPLRLIREGMIDGLRIDHVDGLTQPRDYLRKLRLRVDRAARIDPRQPARRITLHVEKILAHDETLRDEWPVDGTTGYDFMNQVSALLHDNHGRAELAPAWEALTGRSQHFGNEERRARRDMLDAPLATDLARCARALSRFVADTPESGDVTPWALQCVVSEVLEQMPVYRTYLGTGTASDEDRHTLEHVFERATKDGAPDLTAHRAYLRQYLLETKARWLNTLSERRHLQMARRLFEQLSATLNAKAVEDTAFYRYGVLLSRNEVGSDPRIMAIDPYRFHVLMQQRAHAWPRSLLATATHDHKRGEDVRARLAVLSERARWFADQASRWMTELEGPNRPSHGALWMLLQTLLGAWPLDLQPNDENGLKAFAERVEAWFLKAEREAKLDTRWTTLNPIYEEACKATVRDILVSPRYAHLRDSIHAAAHSLDAPGALNGLAAVALRLTVPGVPDLYQGTEYWDQSLVDPDNRRHVDYDSRKTSLDGNLLPDPLLAEYRNGLIKQQLIHRLLRARHRWPELFLRGGYEPLQVTGWRRDHIVAFLRRHENHRLLVAVPRLCAENMVNDDRPMVDKDFWSDTAVICPADDGACTFTDLFTHRTHQDGSQGLSVPMLFSEWPVAVLLS
ncbi:malto-oligosyltrehalose synthase [Dyella nitratireducens]|uniref:Malto-oligosyltrehalose synthase n=1 Tax=Dyella nitratireducens TaxID=1849580 RepID=A0ABQ1GFL0_9GAMM|nr:malto-oligosyltrehalose synthase [Dyella nitratireducens]GGA42678.1 malto-oligosyltrehalose synthase [Dyella nitratireducens]GLQ41971.1 malto-oligosyltrehalose synthase [Dyella nitratireducens]